MNEKLTRKKRKQVRKLDPTNGLIRLGDVPRETNRIKLPGIGPVEIVTRRLGDSVVRTHSGKTIVLGRDTKIKLC